MIRKDHRVKKTKLVGLFLWIVSSVFILCGIGWAAFQYHRDQTSVSDYLIRIQSWMASRQHRLHQGLIKVKQMAVAKSEVEHPVHFEFYTSLPNMQMSNTKPIVADSERKIPIPKSTQAINIVSADELEQELAYQIENARGVKKK